MEPPVKRRRLGELRQDVENEGGEYDGDDDTEAAPVEKRHASAEQDGRYQLAIEKAFADSRFQGSMNRIFEKYGREFEGIGDEIDLVTGEVIIDNGHVENMRHQVDVGILGEEDDHGEEESGEDDVDGGEERDGKSADDLEDEDGTAVADLEDLEMEDARLKDSSATFQVETCPENQPWATDTEDTDVMPDYMQLQGPYPDPDSLGGIPAYENFSEAEEGPGLISGLYDGGGLRYASNLGPYGASPFALGPWEMLPQVHEGYATSNGLASASSADYHFRNQSVMQAQSSFSSPRSGGKWPRGTPSPAASRQRDYRIDETGQSANLFEQHPEEASAFSGVPEYTRQEHTDLHVASPSHHAKTTQTIVTEDSDTVEDLVFSAEDLETSSQTGDDAPCSNQARKTQPSGGVVPDPQESCPTEENDVASLPSQSARASYNKPSHQDFNLACMLSDDETPLFSVPPGAPTSTSSRKNADSIRNPSNVVSLGVNLEETNPRPRRGRPRKHPRPDGNDRRLAAGVSRKEKTRPKPPAAAAAAGPVPLRPDPVIGNVNISTHPSHFMPHPPKANKRGRPRKPDPAPQQLPPHFMHYPPQMFGQPYFYHPFQFGFPPQPFHQSFQPMMQQPYPAFPPQLAYQPFQSPYFQQPLVQLQQQMMRQPVPQLLQQAPSPPIVAEPGKNSQQQPEKPKRGRPRKHPVGYKRCRRKAQMPGLQNGMTALLGGYSNKTPVTEDDWYRLARRLAQDISPLQGGFLFSNGFQVQTQAYAPPRTRPSSLSPKKHHEVRQAESASEEESEKELESNENMRVTELLDTSNDGASPKEQFPQFSLTEDLGSSNSPESPRASGSSESVEHDDDVGFVVMESPQGSVKPVDPTPSPPSPPSSTRQSSPVLRAKGPAVSPTPMWTLSSRTPTPIQTLKNRTPVSHKSDEFGLPSSPMSSNNQTMLTTKESAEKATTYEDGEDQMVSVDEDLELESAAPDISDGDKEPMSAVKDTMPEEFQEDKPTEVELTTRRAVSPELEVSRFPIVPPAPMALMEFSQTTTPNTPEYMTNSVILTPKKLDKTRPSTPSTNLFDTSAPPEPITGEAAPTDRQSPKGSPSLFVSSPISAAPRTPESSRQNPRSTFTTRGSPVPRAAMVPRSAERCTPIFLDVTQAPPKLPIITEKRTMGQFKQAVIAPKTKTQEVRPHASKQISLKSMFTQQTPDKHMERKEANRPSFVAPAPKRHSVLHHSAPRLSTSSRTSKPIKPELDMAKDKKRHKSRRSLLSLVSGSAKGQEVEDDVDELGSPLKSKSSSIKVPTTWKDVAHSTPKIWKSTARTIEDPSRSEREWAREKKKKKRRHTDGHVSKRSGRVTEDNVQECGVDGYTCDRDFCFTCL